jgi:hypothetical protein
MALHLLTYLWSLAPETDDVAQHCPMSGVQQVAAL